jgi:putative transposase
MRRDPVTTIIIVPSEGWDGDGETRGGQVYQVLSRAVGRVRLVRADEDFEAFRRIVIEAFRRHPLRILAYGNLSNHWHFVAWPKADGQVTDYFRWLAHPHPMRWRVAHLTVGHGHLYQGRFKSFPMQSDEHLLTVARYVEPHAVGAALAERPEQWPRGSLSARSYAEDPTGVWTMPSTPKGARPSTTSCGPVSAPTTLFPLPNS